VAAFKCQIVNTSINTSPATAQRGTDGNPDGTNGSPGRSKTIGCGQSITGQTGGNLLINGLTLNGGNGGDGGNGTSNVGIPSHGGAGGPAGGLQIVSDADIVIQGATINGGNGGNGGTGTSTAASAGGSASAFGGAGGPLKPKNYSSPLTISAGGALSITGGLTINLGNAGNGGTATATAKDGASGNSGQPGGDAAGTGGAGGASTPNTLKATGAISGASGVVVNGGRGGNGGAVVLAAGNGGSATGQTGPGGPGGGASGNGGSGGNGGTRTGGNGGPASFTGGNGGGGGNGACGNPVIPGGPGGNGGTQSGGGGAGGAGNSAGADGAVSIVNSFNGGPGGTPNGLGGKAGTGGKPGAPGGGGGSNNTTAGIAFARTDSTSNSFKPGLNADGCAAKPLAVSATLETPNVTDGGVGTATVSIVRSSGFTGPVTVAVKDPQSVTRATVTIPATGTSSTIGFEIPLNAATGSSTWTVVASGTGVPDATQGLQLTIGAPVGTMITYNNCDASRLLIWGASQDGTGPLVRRAVNTTNGSVSFTVASNTATIALTYDLGNNSNFTWIYQGMSSELAALAGTPCPPQAKASLAGIAMNAVAGSARFSVGAASQSVTVPTTGGNLSWVVNSITPGTHTLFAQNTNASGVPVRFYINRTTNTTGTVPVDFQSATLSANPATGGVSLGNLGSLPTTVTLGIIAQGETSPSQIQLLSATGATATVPLTGVSPSLLVAGDLYQVNVLSAGSADTRQVTGYFHDLPTALSKLTLPNPITFTHTCISPSGSPTRVSLSETVDPGLSDYWTAQMTQGSPTSGSRSVGIFVTAGFAGATPGSTHNIVVPDLGAIGAPASSLLQPNTSTAVSKSAIGSSTGGAATATPKDQLIISVATHVLTASCP
jgi:hypothetical protein